MQSAQHLCRAHWDYNGCEFSFNLIQVKLDCKQVTLACIFLFNVYCLWIMGFALVFCFIPHLLIVSKVVLMKNKVLLYTELSKYLITRNILQMSSF